ncbi:MAG: hypothetical protein AABZ08_08410 [Planctomycetota bacterium]
MATIGHSLVGLSFAGLSRAKSRGRTLPYVWIGLMVLMGHLVDVIEWFTVVLVPNWRNGHYLTHSPLATAFVVIVVWISVAVFGNVRRPIVFLLIALAIYSHLLLDWNGGRKALADAYGVMPEDAIGRDGYPLLPMIIAEVWLYGLLLIEVLLLRAASDKVCPQLGRQAAGFLAALAVVAAGTRTTAVWLPVYALAALHAGLLLRRDWSWKIAWGLVPLIPLGICLCGEVYASHLVSRAWNLMMDKQYSAAISMYERSLRFPARASRVTTYVNIGQCYEYMGDPALAETTFLTAIKSDDTPNTGQYWLAWLYANQKWRGTSVYRPEESVRILRVLVDGPIRPTVKGLAVNLLADIEHRSETTPSRK